MKEPSKKRNNKSMMKKSLLLILVAILLPMTASAYDAVVDGIYYNLDKAAKTAEVTSGDNLYVGSISIPQTISFEGVRYQVTSIGESAFKECQELLSADLSVGLLTIGKNAFEGCGLTSMVFPNSLKTIDEYAFWNCQSLASITIPESLTSIGDNAFEE